MCIDLTQELTNDSDLYLQMFETKNRFNNVKHTPMELAMHLGINGLVSWQPQDPWDGSSVAPPPLEPPLFPHERMSLSSNWF